MSMARIQIRWDGFRGGPGFTNLYASTEAGFPEAVNALVIEFKNKTPAGTTLTVPNSGDVIDEANGELIAQWGVGGETIHTSAAAAGSYAAASGAVISWRTNTIHRGHRVRGRTFLVPLAGENFQSDGSLEPGLPTAVGYAGATYIAALGGRAVVWARPLKGAVTPYPLLVPGIQAPIISAVVPDLAAVLRSRRD